MKRTNRRLKTTLEQYPKNQTAQKTVTDILDIVRDLGTPNAIKFYTIERTASQALSKYHEDSNQKHLIEFLDEISI